MRNIFVYLSITLLCLGTSTVFSDHNTDSNNYGHYEWGRSWSNNTYTGKKYNDKWYKNAEDVADPLSSSSNVETTTTRIPTLRYSYASWKANAKIRCDSDDFSGSYWVSAEIITADGWKDSDYGAWDYYGGYPEYEGKHKDEARAYYSDLKTGEGQHAHPKNNASDCYASGYIIGKPYKILSGLEAVIDAFEEESYSHIPW